MTNWAWWNHYVNLIRFIALAMKIPTCWGKMTIFSRNLQWGWRTRLSKDCSRWFGRCTKLWTNPRQGNKPHTNKPTRVLSKGPCTFFHKVFIRLNQIFYAHSDEDKRRPPSILTSKVKYTKKLGLRETTYLRIILPMDCPCLSNSY